MRMGKSFHKQHHSPLAWALAGGATVAAVVALVRSTPDLVRYLRIRRM